MNTHILYSFRRCPYAIRARWSLLLAEIPVELREVSLKDKPNELLTVSSKGTVPVLICSNGFVIEESLEIMLWALNSPNDRKINLSFSREVINLILQNDNEFKYHLDRYKYTSRYKDADRKSEQNAARNILINFNDRLSYESRGENLWLVGNSMSFADIAIWPFVRQYKIAAGDDFTNDPKLSKLRKWLNYFLNHELFNVVMSKYNFWSTGNIPRKFPPE
ncbi:glutathione S-transferase N-terminal domain-containing protein [Prochlorococcus sp. MIT 1300]|uniref:glutathione S-transferase N-terminal domain-containing protein n=1 Tax=Prochlorococcus sp. MIT 1300 TaxID=3096218 RepID=UPI002A765D3D|nr:glutathione S-transferase N-terminal domain-containing protein [Prochlorococcus sp. MIT 1300]